MYYRTCHSTTYNTMQISIKLCSRMVRTMLLLYGYFQPQKVMVWRYDNKNKEINLTNFDNFNDREIQFEKHKCVSSLTVRESVTPVSSCGWADSSVRISPYEKTELLSCDNNVPLLCNHLLSYYSLLQILCNTNNSLIKVLCFGGLMPKTINKSILSVQMH